MKNYLSFGGGVNSVAMMLLLLDEGAEFEAVFVDHGCDWPETYEYTDMLIRAGYKITRIRPEYKKRGIIWNNLYDFCWNYSMVPLRQQRWCTAEFKVTPLQKYFQKPCFNFLGIAFDESHRAKFSSRNGEELRYPLIEHEKTRKDCFEIISAHGLPAPDKSGCFFCPFQKISEWRKLRKIHQDLFCKAKALENRNNEWRKNKGKLPAYFAKKPLDAIVQENQLELWEEMRPPCRCGL
jgi:hypothetical protein